MKTSSARTDRIREHLRVLSVEIGARPTGSPANQRASDHVVRAFRAAGLAVERQGFACLDWRGGEASVRMGEQLVAATASPWMPGGEVTAEIVAVDDLRALRAARLRDRIALVHGELAREQLFPKNFPFVSFDGHQAIVRALEAGPPLAIVAVSPHPHRRVPLMEDGDLEIPVATIAQHDAPALLSERGAVTVRIDGTRIPARGVNVIGRLHPDARERVVVTAHLDTKHGTPGALDNAAGVAAVLELARMLEGVPSERGIELAVLNGEDHFAAPGQRRYLERADLRGVRLAVNLDGVGLVGSDVGVASMGLSEPSAEEISDLRSRYASLRPLAPWPQGDHMLFVSAGVPALALASRGIFELLDTVVHTPADGDHLVDAARIAETCAFVARVLAL